MLYTVLALVRRWRQVTMRPMEWLNHSMRWWDCSYTLVSCTITETLFTHCLAYWCLYRILCRCLHSEPEYLGTFKDHFPAILMYVLSKTATKTHMAMVFSIYNGYQFEVQCHLTLPSLCTRETEVALLHCKTMHILLVIQSPAYMLFMFLAQLCSETVNK